MPVQTDQVYKSKIQILAEILEDWRARIPDIATSPDTMVRLWSEVFANTTEGLFLAMQELYADAFIQSAGVLALQRYGTMYGRPQKLGTLAQGTVRFQGAGGEFIAIGSQVGAVRPLFSDTLIFETLDDVVIPDPGEPAATVAADGGAGVLPAGTYEYAVTFVTLGGETTIGIASNAVVLAINHFISIAIPIGGPGTIARKVYRRLNGGAWQFLPTGTQFSNNSIVAYNDSNLAGTLGGPPPEASTAESVTVDAQAMLTGIAYNVVPGAISEIVSVDADVNAVTNVADFTEGTDPETIEEFRQELLEWVRAPMSGGPLDLVAWATSIEGVETATVFENQLLDGTPALGTNSIRIAGPDGVVPDAEKIAEVQAYLESKDLAGITIIIGTFVALTVTTAVTLTLASGYVVADVEDQVKQAVKDYINSVPVDGTVYIAGLYDAVFGLPGVLTLVVTLPAANVNAASNQKPTAIDANITVT